MYATVMGMLAPVAHVTQAPVGRHTMDLEAPLIQAPAGRAIREQEVLATMVRVGRNTMAPADQNTAVRVAAHTMDLVDRHIQDPVGHATVAPVVRATQAPAVLARIAHRYASNSGCPVGIPAHLVDTPNTTPLAAPLCALQDNATNPRRR